MGNATVDPQWPVCVGCAILSRSLERTETEVPQACRECFQRYCWDGTVNSTRPNTYDPPFRGQALVESDATGLRTSVLVALATAVVGLTTLFI